MEIPGVSKVKPLKALAVKIPGPVRGWLRQSLAFRLWGNEREAVLYFVRQGLMSDHEHELKRKYEEMLRLVKDKQ